MNMFDFNLIAGSVALLMLVGGYAWRHVRGADYCMLVGIVGLLGLILYNITMAAN